MTITERMTQVEDNFNQLKGAFDEKQQQVNALQQEMVEIEKQLLFVKGAYQMLAELKQEEDEKAKADAISERVVEGASANCGIKETIEPKIY